jgi:hypothetical protein
MHNTVGESIATSPLDSPQAGFGSPLPDVYSTQDITHRRDLMTQLKDAPAGNYPWSQNEPPKDTCLFKIDRFRF